MKLLLPILSLVALAGCSSSKKVTSLSTPLDARLVAEMRSARTPEYGAGLFADSIPAAFRAAALQAVQFHRTKKKWPSSKMELEQFFGEPISQAYRLWIQTDGALAIGWDSAVEPAPAVVRLTTDYVISFSILPAVEESLAIRKKRLEHEVRSQAVGSALQEVIRSK